MSNSSDLVSHLVPSGSNFFLSFFFSLPPLTAEKGASKNQMAAEVTTLSDLPWIDDNISLEQPKGGGGRLDMTWAERIKDPDSDFISEF